MSDQEQQTKPDGGASVSTAMLCGRERAYWLADKIGSLGDYAKEAALVLRQQADAIEGGWKEAAIAWEVCGSIHEKWAKGKDALYSTRHADFVKHATAARERLTHNVEFSGGAPLYGAASAGTQG